MIESNNVDLLTSVWLCTNTDGVHVNQECIGYIDQHPFIVLTELINKYYVYGYNKNSLYSAYEVGYNKFIFIKNEGYSYSYKHYAGIPKVKNVDTFIEMYEEELKDAEINSDYNDEYLNILSVCLDNGNTDIQYALDLLMEDYTNINESDPRCIIYENYRQYKNMIEEINGGQNNG